MKTGRNICTKNLHLSGNNAGVGVCFTVTIFVGYVRYVIGRNRFPNLSQILFEYIYIYIYIYFQILGIYFACYNVGDNGTTFVGPQSMIEGGEKCSALDGENRVYCRNTDNSGSRPSCKTEKQGKVKKQACAIVSCHGKYVDPKVKHEITIEYVV